MITALSTYRMTRANTRKTEAETRIVSTKAETEILALEANRSTQFEHMLNERVTRLVDSLEKQISFLSKTVEEQSMKLAAQTQLLLAQSSQIADMDFQIKRLTSALDERTEQLRKFMDSPTINH